ncbi:MAG TPA: 1-deoxy-D-xylulose-5-phosphate reductoisomerase [Paludibacteraceae bacterium]|nr:1-deoxy-D-xylulose-5-phosphate reductoisomerase [Paludibacteraceae bacterium]HPL93786.1 1-deoxy-D-xylulose-5-phosphate reductoisomerase [Paludibacteraceae bacterium]
MNKKQIAILGSTGSIGTQALEVIAAHPDKFEVYAITANNSVDLLIEQAVRFQPEMVIIANEQHYAYIKKALENYPIKVYAGVKAICEMVELPSVDVVLTAMVGYAGLLPTIHAVKAGKRIALANKETLVVAGEIICDLAQQYRSAIIPVDSEHSAIFQCLIGEQNASVEKIILTASGGPFRQKTYDELRQVTTRDALKHPNWEMGAKITIDSASLMNKGFEVIEAKWLFGLKPSQIEVLIHPQSIIHSMVQFVDGSVKAQIGLPDMKLPIQYAFAFPQRIENNYPRLDFTQYARFDFQQPDTSKFRNLAFAYDAMEKGGTMPCVLNAANEVVVAAFLEEKIGFLHMSDIIEKTMQTASWIAKPTYEDYVLADKQARELTLAQF